MASSDETLENHAAGWASMYEGQSCGMTFPFDGQIAVTLKKNPRDIYLGKKIGDLKALQGGRNWAAAPTFFSVQLKSSGGIKCFPISVFSMYIIMTRITFQGSFRVACEVDRIKGSF